MLGVSSILGVPPFYLEAADPFRLPQCNVECQRQCMRKVSTVGYFATEINIPNCGHLIGNDKL